MKEFRKVIYMNQNCNIYNSSFFLKTINKRNSKRVLNDFAEEVKKKLRFYIVTQRNQQFKIIDRLKHRLTGIINTESVIDSYKPFNHSINDRNNIFEN